VPFVERSGTLYLHDIEKIVVDPKYADLVDNTGETLIPPTLEEFAITFQQDLNSTFGVDLPVVKESSSANNAIVLTLDGESDFLDAASRHTAEGYKLTIDENTIKIAGASALGTWWGSRSVMQLAALNDQKLPCGEAIDSPGWATRGMLLDGGRHFYPTEFVVEMCAYLSFFKQNTLQLHLSDNLNNYPERYSHERTLSLYAAFRPWSEDPRLAGLNTRKNESYTRDEFEDMQQQCAKRGVTIIPEIETPGHALAIVQWKPEIGLPDMSMLNISHPETIPTIQMIWSVLLPWFHSKSVHIGADEYDKKLVPEYARFVNEMAAFIKSESNKTTRVWGTFSPKQGSNVTTDVVQQQWALYHSNGLFDYIKNGYKIINAYNYFYAVNKYSAAYPPPLKAHKAFVGSPDGSPFAPNILDVKNPENNPARDNPHIMGHLISLWNDWGPNGTTVLEGYQAIKDAMPALGDKQWGGDLTEDEYDQVLETLRKAIPGQNLERRIASKSDLILHYKFANCSNYPGIVRDRSGNKYHGQLRGEGCMIEGSRLKLSGNCYLETPLESKGEEYTLSFSVKPGNSKQGILFDGPDSTLLAGEMTDNNVTMSSGGNDYVLNYTLPVDTWSDVSLTRKSDRTYLAVSQNGGAPTTMEFLTVLGIWGLRYVWAPMAFEAPLARIGEGFVGELRNISLTSSS
jgi:hexosaminidase